MFIPLAKSAESAKFAWPVAAASCASEPHLAAKIPSITKNMCTWHIYCIYTFTLNLICFCGFAASEFVQMPACCFESWQNSKDATQSCQSPASASRKSLRRPLGNRNSFQTNAMQSKLKKMSSLCCILKLKNLYQLTYCISHQFAKFTDISKLSSLCFLLSGFRFLSFFRLKNSPPWPSFSIMWMFMHATDEGSWSSRVTCEKNKVVGRTCRAVGP